MTKVKISGWGHIKVSSGGLVRMKFSKVARENLPYEPEMILDIDEAEALRNALTKHIGKVLHD